MVATVDQFLTLISEQTDVISSPDSVDNQP